MVNSMFGDSGASGNLLCVLFGRHRVQARGAEACGASTVVSKATIESIGVVCLKDELQQYLVRPVPESCSLCSVCIQPIKPSHTVRGLGCGHAFHKRCVDDWFLIASSPSNLKCPLCRAPALQQPELRKPRPTPRVRRAFFSGWRLVMPTLGVFRRHRPPAPAVAARPPGERSRGTEPPRRSALRRLKDRWLTRWLPRVC